ncbi:MAG: DNA polymerase III subunit [Breznakibacter sp.]
MLFREILGQDRIKNQLIRMEADGRVAHAILFAGMAGCGAFQLALAFAQYLNCTGERQGDACGHCPSCIKFNKLVHPDLHFVYPVVKRDNNSNPVSDDVIDKWRSFVLASRYFTVNQWFGALGGEKQGLIYGGESQEIIRKLSLKTYEGRYKIMIIWLPEKMNPTASNKLLKILEEPPQGTLFLLVSENPNDILPTILSRAQMIKVPGIDDAILANQLQQEFGVDAVRARQLAKIALGSYVAACEGVQQSEEQKAYFGMFVSLMRICYARKVPDMIALVDQVAALSRDAQKNFLNYAIQMLRENFILNQGEASLVYMMPDEEAFAQKFAPFIHEGNVFQMSDEFGLAIAHIEQNGNGRIIMMDLMLKLTILLLTPKP